MAIGYARSDGTTGVYETPTEAAMPVQETKSSRVELTPQQRIDQGFEDTPKKRYLDQNNPFEWGMKEALSDQGNQTEQRDLDISGDIRRGSNPMIEFGEALPISAQQSLPSDQPRLEEAFKDIKKYNFDFGNPELTHDFEGKSYRSRYKEDGTEEFLEVPQWHLGFGRRIISDPNTGLTTTPEEYRYLRDNPALYNKYRKQHDENIKKEMEDRELFQMSPNQLRERLKKSELPTIREQLDSFQSKLAAMPQPERPAFLKFIDSLSLMPAADKPQEDWTAKEHLGVMLNTAMSGMGAGYRAPTMSKVSWPEGWGTKSPSKATGYRVEEYPHIQKAFKEAVESGATTTPEIRDHLLLNGIDVSASTVQNIKAKAGLLQAPREKWSPEKRDEFMGMLKSGKTDKEISESMGLTRSAIISQIERLKKSDPDFTRTYAPPAEAMRTNVDKIKELADKGMTNTDIAKELGFTRQYISRLASAADIDVTRDPKFRGGGAKRGLGTEWRGVLRRQLKLED